MGWPFLLLAQPLPSMLRQMCTIRGGARASKRALVSSVLVRLLLVKWATSRAETPSILGNKLWHNSVLKTC